MLYLIEILHQTTTSLPLLCAVLPLYLIEILHQTTTRRDIQRRSKRLYLIEILHQTTTFPLLRSVLFCCILSKFYIKPQHFDFEKRVNYVVSYRNSTSNHNFRRWLSRSWALYLIEILHQTTTRLNMLFFRNLLYLIEILHQTTTIPPYPVERRSCILSKFYIKPQHFGRRLVQ